MVLFVGVVLCVRSLVAAVVNGFLLLCVCVGCWLLLLAIVVLL